MNLSQQLEDIRKKAVAAISDTLDRVGADSVWWSDVEEGNAPIIVEDPYDSNNSFTLDRLDKNGVQASSSSGTMPFSWDDVDIEVVVNIADTLLKKEKDLSSGDLYRVECTIIYNGNMLVRAESGEAAIDKASELLDAKYGDDFPSEGVFGKAYFNFGEATADYVELVND